MMKPLIVCSFLFEPSHKERLPEIKRQVIEMSLNGSGVRDAARVLQISTATVIQEWKKRPDPQVGEYASNDRNFDNSVFSTGSLCGGPFH